MARGIGKDRASGGIMSQERQPLDLFDRAVVPALGVIAAVLLFTMMALTCIDVVGRYIFSRPVYGAFEITEMLLAALIFAGLPLVTLRGEHIMVDVFDAITPDWLFRLQHIAACAFAFVATAYLSWRLWIRAERLDSAGETTAQLHIRLANLTYAMAILMALTSIAFLVIALRRPHRHTPGEGPGT
jgi:TRAP-type C4-dicarboxylate transport system permease small subunit